MTGIVEPDNPPHLDCPFSYPLLTLYVLGVLPLTLSGVCVFILKQAPERIQSLSKVTILRGNFQSKIR